MLALLSMVYAHSPSLFPMPALPPWEQAALVPPPVVNGESTSDYPEVPLLYMVDRSGYGALCTGSLIHPEWILTAAHCITDDSSFQIVAIDIGFGSTARNLETTARAEDWIPHPYYNGQGYYDIGLVKLNKAINDYPLMKLSIDGLSDTDRGEDFRVVGFGMTSDHDNGSNTAKRYADLPLTSFDERLMVTWDRQGGSNACHGDSGGPILRLYDNGSYAVAGVVNFAYGDTWSGDCEGNGVASARVDYYLDWIEGYVSPEIYGDSPTDSLGSMDEIEPGPPLGPLVIENPTRPKAVGENYDVAGCSSVGAPLWLGLAGLLGLRRRR